MEKKRIFVLLMTIFIFGSNCCNIFQFIETAHADPLVSIILDEGFEDIFPPIGWTNTGWVDSLYGFPHGGSSWAYSWAKGDTLTTKILSFGTHTNLSFWYSIEKVGHPMSLEVYIDETTIIWSMDNFSKPGYFQAVINLSTYHGDNTINFVGLTSDFYGQCLDDIIVTTQQDEICEDIDLLEGWNLITIPMQTSWYASDIAENITGCQSISRWDSSNQTYKTFIVGGPPAFDFEIKSGCGYYVDMVQSDIISVCGSRIDNVSIPLNIGWNLLGWFHEVDTTASSLSENIPGCLSVSKWDCVNQTYKTFIVGGPPAFDFPVFQGMGLFVDVTQTSMWYGEG